MKERIFNLWMWFVAIVATAFIACAVLGAVGVVAMGAFQWLK